jgi:hypothetical protein
MPFIWAKKIQQVTQPQVVVQPEQIVEIPIFQEKEDKISVIEHKEDGKCLVSSREEDNAFGSGEEEVNGQEVVLPCVENSKVELQGEE